MTIAASEAGTSNLSLVPGVSSNSTKVYMVLTMLDVVLYIGLFVIFLSFAGGSLCRNFELGFVV